MLRVEVLVAKLMNLDIYVREMMQLNLAHMTRIKYHHHKTVNIDTEDTSYCSADEEEENAYDDCEHDKCHKVHC